MSYTPTAMTKNAVVQKWMRGEIDDGGCVAALERNCEELSLALEEFAETGYDLTNAMCHKGLVTADKCGRCGKVIRARALLARIKGQ